MRYFRDKEREQYMQIKRAFLMGTLLFMTAAAAQAQSAVSLKCVPQRPTDNRPSPYDSLRISVGSNQAVLCFSRPSAGGRTMIGGAAVPFGKLWRTGANEPTIIHVGFSAMIAGVHVEPGSYSIYTVPCQDEWEVIINRSITQWGIERQYTDQVRAQEVGRGKARTEKLSQHVEKLTFRAENVSNRGADLMLEWEKTAVRIPIRRM
jgi:hypothetical protein